MRRLLVGVIAAGALCTTSGGRAHAQTYSLLKFGVGGGPSFPIGDLGDVVGVGFNARAILGLGAPGLPVGVRVEATYDWFPLKDEVRESACAGRSTCSVSGNAGVVSGTLNVVYAFPVTTRARPYVIGGGGVYHQRLRVDVTGAGGTETGSGVASQTRAGVNVGAGFRYDYRRWNIFAEARFVNVFTKDIGGTGSASRFVPVTIGVIF